MFLKTNHLIKSFKFISQISNLKFILGINFYGIKIRYPARSRIKARRSIMGVLIKADFQNKLTSKLAKYRPQDKTQGYQKEVFSELFSKFPQFKAHVAAYVERNYCGVVINDEDHSSSDALFDMLTFEEIHMLNKWIVNRRGSILIS